MNCIALQPFKVYALEEIGEVILQSLERLRMVELTRIDDVTPSKNISTRTVADAAFSSMLDEFKGKWEQGMTLNEIDAEVNKMREGWR